MLKLSIACVLVVLLFVSASTQKAASSTRTRAIVRTIHIGPIKQNNSRYYYVPFEVGAFTDKVTVRYDYDRANGTNALDLGLFDPRFSPATGEVSGFRGWSGGRRSEVFVAQKIATPGYLAGEIEPGTWRVILGLYRVAPVGVDVTLKIELETNEIETTKPVTATSLSQIPKFGLVTAHQAQTKAVGSAKESLVSRWVSGDLHMHTVHSDGDWTVAQLVNAALEAGLDFISITDHNTSSHHSEIDNLNIDRKNPLVIRGEEITTYGGHANAWGLAKNSLIDFRVTPGDQTTMSRLINQTHQHGALISINHPFAVCAGCMWNYGIEAQGFDAIEVWNGSWDAADELSLGFWDRLLQQGRRITAIASSDSHRAENPLGQAATHVRIKGGLSEGSVLGSIHEGRVYLTSRPTRPIVTFEACAKNSRVPYAIGDVIRLSDTHTIHFKIAVASLSSPAAISLISDGKVVRTFQLSSNGIGQDVEVTVSHNTYFRIEVRDESGAMLALSNPIYVQLQTQQ